MNAGASPSFGWLGIVRLGLVQTSLGAIVILMTSTLNRVMVVELGLAAAIPGLLVGWHYAVQMSRPRWGYGADAGGRRAPWILGGMAVLAFGAISAAFAASLIPANFWAGFGLSVLAYALIGAGVGAAGTNLLALLAIRTEPSRKAAAAAIVWIMMIMGFVLTAGIGGGFLKPFSFDRLILVTSVVSAIALVVTFLALRGLEPASAHQAAPAPSAHDGQAFRAALRETWADPQARRFTIFVFVSMLAYSAQDLILEPFAGLVHGYDAGSSTQLAGVQNMGTLVGMILTAVAGTVIGKSRAGFMRTWTVGGCIASAAALLALGLGTQAMGTDWPLVPNVIALGVANGAFAVAAIGSMMTLASAGPKQREGTRMGVWGAAQAVAFGLGGFIGAAAVDVARALMEAPAPAFALVFAVEGLIFLVAAALALRVGETSADTLRLPVLPSSEFLTARSGEAT
ncbi:BCD family MFS transporter [Hyphomonas sp.]|uniref:BCD family MFS transporter n=1 Tax=Hyphomonas sp. TaxID=87 RepID=UPI000AFBDF6D|nr:BCD family MFS transporter [Hyphomonas sp.]MBA4339320.1 MFS transporter [Hyphomonas sp.]